MESQAPASYRTLSPQQESLSRIDMKRATEPDWAYACAWISAALFSGTVVVGSLGWLHFRRAGTGGDAGFAVMGEAITLLCGCGLAIALSWMLAVVAAWKCRIGVILVVLETLCLLLAICVL